jgi:hypothetical protein
MTIPAYGAEKETSFQLAYSDHGGKFPVTKPAAANRRNPPQVVYDMLRSDAMIGLLGCYSRIWWPSSSAKI